MTALFASLLAAGSLAGPAAPPRLLVAGPVLAGRRIVWGEQRDAVSVLRAWPDSSPLWQSATNWFAGPLAGSENVVAFSHSYEGCPGQPGVACPVETQTLAGPPHGSLRPLGKAERCTNGGARRRLAVSGPLVAFVAVDCDSSGATVTVHSGARIVFQRQGVSCCDVSLAGRYVAWKSGAAVDVLDLQTRRRVYRAEPPAGEPIAAFDVQADGKLALILGPATDGRAALAWRAPGQATLNRLKLHVGLPLQGPVLRLVRDHLVVASATALTVIDLNGRQRVLARFTQRVEKAGGIDADADRVTWASRRITSKRVDCPPPGQGRPCILRKSGIETVWTAGLTSGVPHAVAHWTFIDAP